jgi:hypothetical protein
MSETTVTSYILLRFPDILSDESTGVGCDSDGLLKGLKLTEALT